MSNEPTYTWESVLAAVAPPTDEQRALYALGDAPAALVESGARIRSEKILTDLVRWCGQVAEFMPKASPAQKRLLLGYSDGFFRVTVHEGAKLRDMVASRTGGGDDREAKRTAVIAAAGQAYRDGMDERDRLSTALEGLLQYDPELRERLALAVGRVDDPDGLARSLRALVKLTESLLAVPASVLAQQLVDGGVTAQELAGTQAVADNVEATAKAADGARAQAPVTQAELDRQDGVCLAHMRRLMRLFNGAHDKDPTIPRLTAIATRSIFAPPRKAPAAAKGEDK